MMKTMFASALFVVLFCSIVSASLSPPVWAAEARKAKKIGDKYYLSMNDAALLLGATKFWNGETRKAVLNMEGTRIRLTVHSSVVAVGEKTYVLPSPVLFVRGVLFIPIELFTETLPAATGKSTAWNPDTQYLSMLKEGTVPATVSVQASGGVTYVTVESPERIEYSLSGSTRDGFAVLIEDAAIVGKPELPAGGLVRRLATGRAAGGVELRLTLSPDASGYSMKREANPERIVIGVTSSPGILSTSEFRRFETEAPGVASGRDYRVVVIDAGHGGRDEGIKAGKSVEKQTNLEIARWVKNALSGVRGMDVVLTRNDDSQMSVEERAVKANTVRGDIFVSLHCDGYSNNQASGYSVEVFEPREALGTASWRGRSGERASFASPGYIDIRPWKQVAGSYIRESTSLAKDISRSLGRIQGLKDAGFRRAPLVQCDGVDMPCVSVNCGFLTNEGDEALLRETSGQRKIAGAIAQGIIDFVSEMRR
jgi:N-acetylmuramoyl-L-alanine amidase